MKSKTTNSLKESLLLLMIFSTIISSAQITDWGNLYVADYGQLHVASGAYTFISPLTGSQTATTKSGNYGNISFADAITTTTGAGTVRFVDGYLRKYGGAAIIMPIGNSSKYGPIKVDPSNTTGIDGAYYRADPTVIGATLDDAIESGKLSSVEYWHIKRPTSGTANAKISLSWSTANLSNIAGLTNSSLLSLTIAGYDGSKWVVIPSAFDATNVIDASTTTLTDGSITSTGDVDLSAYQYFTLAGKADCSPLIASSGNTKTWNGTWSPSAPTLADPVTLNAHYSGNLSCNSLAMGAFNVTIGNGELLEVVNGITGTGKVIMASEASLVQRNSASAAPTIELTKVSRNMHWRDYMYYGTPIAGNFTSQIITNTWNDNITGTPGSFDINDPYGYGGPWKYVVGGGGWNALNAGPGIVTGKGFIARIKGNAPFNVLAGASGNLAAPDASLLSPSNVTTKVSFKFAGVANNGNVSVPVTVSISQYELLANPYPSALDAQKFLTGNSNLDGSLYFWTASTPVTAGVYAASGDYATWSLAGSTNIAAINASIPASANPPMTPDGKIASGQGFRVKVDNATSSTNAVFTNCMRLTGGNNTFFRSAAIDRYKMNVQDNSNNNYYNQLVVAYMPNTTNDYDRMYDAESFSTSKAKLYTLMADGKKLTINARATFNDSDVVPLGFSNSSAEQSFTIRIEDKEGIFATNTVNVYIHDLLDNTYHDMATPFVFNANGASNLNNRFEIVYQASALSSTDFLANSVVVNIKNNVFYASANEINIINVEIFDMTGRKIQSYNTNNKTSLAEPFIHAEGIYIAKVKLENGTIATQKLINKK